MSRLCLAIIGAIAVLTAAVATASTDRAPTAHVAYADLDLAQRGDMTVLRRRAAIAIHNVCGGQPSGDMAITMRYARCRAAAERSAAIQIAAIRASRALAQEDIWNGIARR